MNVSRLIVAMLMMPGLIASASQYTTAFGHGVLSVEPLADNAVRVRYAEAQRADSLPDWTYEGGERYSRNFEVKHGDVDELVLPGITLVVDRDAQKVTARDAQGREIFASERHVLSESSVQGEPTYVAEMSWQTADGEHLYGLGQFQDGYNDVRGLSRRLTQVNTQISLPMIVSSKGYGLLWNNYGMTEFNPCRKSVTMTRGAGEGVKSVVDVTSAEGTVREVREDNRYSAEIDLAESGQYRLLLDVGQSMARRHNLVIDGVTVVDARNLWLPPTASALVELGAGRHVLTADLSRGDNPTVYYDKVDDVTTFRSAVAECVDYTLFAGSGDEVVAAYHKVTGRSPMLPKWAFGYIHCRERYHTQQELLDNAAEFRKRQLPVDVMVQDWQYWGKHGWNAMTFDEELYPDPAKMVSALHDMNMRLMLSVWAKVDENSEVGKQMSARGYYIPGTTWVDFFNPDAADFYWQNSSSRLLKPYGIDAWWQDATEPENDDLCGRRVNGGKMSGERVRNAFPLMVNRVVYAGLRRDDPERRPLILTRCAFPGIQRYGVAVWTGDVGNDWATLRRQITAGLGVNAAGHPWWTYDAGGFFRPGNQYSDEAYKERMVRWIQASVFLPLMRVHGYQSDTEPWRYGEQTEQVIAESIRLRYRLLPYIYSEAWRVSADGRALMRPLVFDFPTDEEALGQECEFMFGQSLLVNPVTESGVSAWRTYLPVTAGGWYDFYSGKHYAGGEYVDLPVTIDRIPVMVRAGSILPVGAVKQYSSETVDEPIELRIYAGADGEFVLYDDDGTTNQYEQGASSRIAMKWDDGKRTLTIGKREGTFVGMPTKCSFTIVVSDGTAKRIKYNGKSLKIKI